MSDSQKSRRLYDHKVSKYLSFVLRHEPQSIGLTMDEHGWVSIDELLYKAKHKMTREEIELAVRHNEKQRFAIEGNKIRANQGHSIDVDVDLTSVEPPEFLYHGTAVHLLAAIYIEGLVKMNRLYVHLSDNPDTAVQVGKRHGEPHVLTVNALVMHHAGHEFFKSANGVYLVNAVPTVFLF